MKQLLTATILFISVASFGQLNNLEGQANNILREKTSTVVEGNSLYLDEWVYGIVTSNTGKQYENILLNYDSYNDQILMNKMGQEQYLDPKYTSSALLYMPDGVKVRFKNGYKVPGFKATSYFHVIYEGSFTVLKRYETSLMTEVVEQYGTSDQRMKFNTTETYIYISEEGGVNELKTSNRAMKDFYGPYQDEMKDFMKENSLKHRRDEDLTAIFSKFDELTENS